MDVNWDWFNVAVCSFCIRNYSLCWLDCVCEIGHPKQKKRKEVIMHDVLLTTSILFFALTFFVLTFGVMRIADAKEEINRKLCNEKIRYANEKKKIEIELLQEKKKIELEILAEKEKLRRETEIYLFNKKKNSGSAASSEPQK